MNHGGCGATPKYVIAKQKSLVDAMERNPDRWFKQTVPHTMRTAAANLASFIGADPQDVVFVVNATTGINSVIRSTDLQQGDAVLCLDLTYRPVLNTLRFVCAVKQELVDLVELPIPLPLPDADAIVHLVEVALSENPNVRLAVFDHITSPTALVLPVARLVAACRRQNVTVLIDGAHAPGQLPLNVRELGADYYVGTCHKWLFAPKGTAFLFARPGDTQDAVRPVVTATASNAGFVPDFLFQGTRDETAFCCVPTALQLYGGLGPERIRGYNRLLVDAASSLLSVKWGTEILAPPSLRGAFMAAIRVPLPFETGVNGQSAADLDGLLLSPICHDLLQELLQREHRIEYVKLFNFGKRVWVRISCQT